MKKTLYEPNSCTILHNNLLVVHFCSVKSSYTLYCFVYTYSGFCYFRMACEKSVTHLPKVNYILIEFMSSEVSLKKLNTAATDVTVFLLNCGTSFRKLVVVPCLGQTLNLGLRDYIQGHKWAVICDIPCVCKNLLL
jgi:hypothetical protein